MALHSINLTTCRKNVASLKCCSYSNRFYDGNYLGEKKKTKQKSCLWWISKRLDVLVDSTRREVESNCVHNNNYYASDSIRTIEQKKPILFYDQRFCKFCKSPFKITHAGKYAWKSVHNFFLWRIFSGFGVNEEKLLITSVSCIYLESKEFFRIVIAVVMLIDRSFWPQISSVQNVPVCRHCQINPHPLVIIVLQSFCFALNLNS